jgi:hypothetical protein
VGRIGLPAPWQEKNMKTITLEYCGEMGGQSWLAFVNGEKDNNLCQYGATAQEALSKLGAEIF